MILFILFQDTANAVQLGYHMEKLIFDLADTHFFFNDLEVKCAALVFLVNTWDVHHMGICSLKCISTYRNHGFNGVSLLRSATKFTSTTCLRTTTAKISGEGARFSSNERERERRRVRPECASDCMSE